MLLGETVAVALASIRANLLRAALTMLGIIIGVGAVITMVALGEGAQQRVEDQGRVTRRRSHQPEIGEVGELLALVLPDVDGEAAPREPVHLPPAPGAGSTRRLGRRRSRPPPPDR